MISDIFDAANQIGINSLEELVIFDIGARDCFESLQLSKIFPNAKVYAFECNPEAISLCKAAIQGNSRIFLNEICVFDYDGEILFHPIDPSRTITSWPDGNIGASSIFVANGDYNTIETYVQNEITVPCTRLDTWMDKNNISKVDLIWMDLQGAELQAIKGLGKHISSLKVIHTESEMKPIYTNQSLFLEIDAYLRDNGMELIGNFEHSDWASDVLYVRR